MDDVEQIQRDLHHLGLHISPRAAQKMIDAGWKKRFEPTINQIVIPQAQNPIPDMRMHVANSIYGTMDQTR